MPHKHNRLFCCISQVCFFYCVFIVKYYLIEFLLFFIYLYGAIKTRNNYQYFHIFWKKESLSFLKLKLSV